MTRFLHKTVRAEWYVLEPDGKESGPYSSDTEADMALHVCTTAYPDKDYSIIYREADVPIDPIVSELLDTVCKMIEGHVDQKLILKKKPRRKAVYLHENAIRGSLRTLSSEIKNLIQTDLENPYAEAHPR